MPSAGCVVTSPADIGRLTTEIYLHQPRITNEVVFVAGKRLYAKLAEMVERVRDAANFYLECIDATLTYRSSSALHPHDSNAALSRRLRAWWFARAPMSDNRNVQHHLPSNIQDGAAARLKTQQ